jgi:hypothetical protein
MRFRAFALLAAASVAFSTVGVNAGTLSGPTPGFAPAGFADARLRYGDGGTNQTWEIAVGDDVGAGDGSFDDFPFVSGTTYAFALDWRPGGNVSFMIIDSFPFPQVKQVTHQIDQPAGVGPLFAPTAVGFTLSALEREQSVTITNLQVNGEAVGSLSNVGTSTLGGSDHVSFVYSDFGMLDQLSGLITFEFGSTTLNERPAFSMSFLEPTAIPEPLAAIGGISLLSIVGLRRRQSAV